MLEAAVLEHFGQEIARRPAASRRPAPGSPRSGCGAAGRSRPACVPATARSAGRAARRTRRRRRRSARLGLCGLVQRQGEAPDLFALLLAERLEELGEARDQVGLGEQHIDREAHARASRAAPSGGGGWRGHGPPGSARPAGDRSDRLIATMRAVDRLAAAVLLAAGRGSPARRRCRPRRRFPGWCSGRRCRSARRSSVNHQSQLRVPPTPPIAALPISSASGNLQAGVARAPWSCRRRAGRS